MSLDEFAKRERRFWADNTIVGFVFTLATLFGLAVGTVICAQLLSSIVWDFRMQFSTLNAIGFRKSFVGAIVAVKALTIAVLGFTLCWFISRMLYAVLSEMTGLSFQMPIERVILVLGLTVLMTVVAGLAALRPLLRQDPAELFRE